MIISRGSPGLNCKNKKQGSQGWRGDPRGELTWQNQQKASGEGEGGWGGVCHDN